MPAVDGLRIVRVFVTRQPAGLHETLARMLGGTPFEVVTSGEFKALPGEDG